MVMGGGPRDATVRWMRPGGARHAPGRGGGLAFKAVGRGGVGCRGVAHQRRGVPRTKPEQYCSTHPFSGAVTSRAVPPPRTFRDGVGPRGRRSRGRAGGKTGQLPRPLLGSAGAADCADAPLLRCQGHCLHCRQKTHRFALIGASCRFVRCQVISQEKVVLALRGDNGVLGPMSPAMGQIFSLIRATTAD